MRLSALSEHNAEAKKQGCVAKIEGGGGENLKFSGEKLKFAGEKKSIHLRLPWAVLALAPSGPSQ